MKKQLHPLVGGTLLLTAAGLMTRLIGFFYKIFLSRAIGAEGIGIYQMIFPIYGVCYALTTSGAEIAGFPLRLPGKWDRTSAERKTGSARGASPGSGACHPHRFPPV